MRKIYLDVGFRGNKAGLIEALKVVGTHLTTWGAPATYTGPASTDNPNMVGSFSIQVPSAVSGLKKESTVKAVVTVYELDGEHPNIEVLLEGGITAKRKIADLFDLAAGIDLEPP